jgi:hypothetical protein
MNENIWMEETSIICRKIIYLFSISTYIPLSWTLLLVVREWWNQYTVL